MYYLVGNRKWVWCGDVENSWTFLSVFFSCGLVWCGRERKKDPKPAVVLKFLGTFVAPFPFMRGLIYGSQLHKFELFLFIKILWSLTFLLYLNVFWQLETK